jgi:integrase
MAARSLPDALYASPSGEDYMRRRLQQKGDLRKQGQYWTLRWREDHRAQDGTTLRGWSQTVVVCPATKTEKQAQRIAWEDWLSKIDQNNSTPMSVVPVREFVDRKFRPEHIALLKPAGRIHYEQMLRLVLPDLGEMRLRDVRLEHVQRCISGILLKSYTKGKITKRYSTQTALHVKNVVSALFSHARAHEWYTGENPAENVKLPEMERREAHALTFEQLKSVLQSTTYPAHQMALVIVLTSMNVAELCGLKWKRVNLSDQWATCDGESLPPWTLVVREQWRLGQYMSVKAQSRKRPLPIPLALRPVLAELKARPRWTAPDDPVFSSRNGTPIDEHNVAARVLKKVGVALDMPWLGWHSFRRTHTTLADQLEMSLGDRMAMMGHSDPRMTMLYTRPDLERRREVMDKMAGFLFEEKGPVQ